MASGSDFSANAIAEASVSTTGPAPFVEQVRFTLVKPARLKLIAKVEGFEAITRYRVMPDGKPVPSEQVSDATGSVLGKQGRIRTTITFSDQRATRG